MPNTHAQSFFSDPRRFQHALPILTGVLLLINLLNPVLENQYARWFTGNYLTDPLIGAVAGSLSFGIPIPSPATSPAASCWPGG